MEKEHKEYSEEDETLLALIYAQFLSELADLLLALQKLENFGKANHSNQLVKFTNSGKTSKNRSLVVAAEHDVVDWQDRDKIDDKPTFNVLFRNLVLVCDVVDPVLVTHCGEKREDDVNEENNVRGDVENEPSHRLALSESQPHGNYNTDSKEQDQY